MNLELEPELELGCFEEHGKWFSPAFWYPNVYILCPRTMPKHAMNLFFAVSNYREVLWLTNRQFEGQVHSQIMKDNKLNSIYR